MQKVGQTP